MTYVLIAQFTADMIKPFAEVGWPGIFLWVVVSRFDRMERALTDLSSALWANLAANPSSEELVKEEARKRLAKIESAKSKS